MAGPTGRRVGGRVWRAQTRIERWLVGWFGGGVMGVALRRGLDKVASAPLQNSRSVTGPAVPPAVQSWPPAPFGATTARPCVRPQGFFHALYRWCAVDRLATGAKPNRLPNRRSDEWARRTQQRGVASRWGTFPATAAAPRHRTSSPPCRARLVPRLRTRHLR
jgi:hypothetical protein